MEQWANYFIATAGAAAALAGLLFVGVSLNLTKILSLPHLPGRALGSLVLLTNILLSGSFCLVPGQSTFWLGCELLLLGVFVWSFNLRLDLAMFRLVDKKFLGRNIQNLVFGQLAILPYIVAGILLLNGCTTGFYLLVPGITFSFIKAMVDAWVLLIEINR